MTEEREKNSQTSLACTFAAIGSYDLKFGKETNYSMSRDTLKYGE